MAISGAISVAISGGNFCGKFLSKFSILSGKYIRVCLKLAPTNHNHNSFFVELDFKEKYERRIP